MSGLPGRPPAGTGTNYPDHIPAPAHAALAVLAALRHRRRTGRGQYVDVSQAETMVSLLGPTMLDYAANGHLQMPQGNRVASAAPNGVYRCAGEDRWIAISAVTDRHWVALADELGRPDLAADSRFGTQAGRHEHHGELDELIAAATATREPYELMEKLQSGSVPAGVVQSYRDLLGTDPQLRFRGQFVRLDHPEMGTSVYDRPPFVLTSVTEPVMRTPAPLLGQHTREVCRDLLDLSDADIDSMASDGLLV